MVGMNRARFLTTTTLTIVLILNALISTSVISSNPSKYETPVRALDATSSTTIYIDPPNMTSTSGTDFTVDMKIENVTDLYAFEARLEWDPKVLNLVNVTQGDFLPSPAGWIVEGNQTEGNISVVSYFLSGAPGIGVNGSGTLGKITFHAADAGECTLHFNDTKLFTLVSVPSPPNLGDVNNDMKVNAVDLGYMSQAWGSSEGQPRYNPNADFNHDGYVGLFDLICVVFNFAHTYGETGTALLPTEITHQFQDGYVTILPFGTVTWKWLNIDNGQSKTLTAHVTVSSNNPTQDFSFNRSRGQISFRLTTSETSDELGYCNVSIPKLLMDGAFEVLINDTEAPAILTWNKTHTSVYFTYEQGSIDVAIRGELLTNIRILSKDTTKPYYNMYVTLVDLNDDGIVNILDVTSVAIYDAWHWKEED